MPLAGTASGCASGFARPAAPASPTSSITPTARDPGDAVFEDRGVQVFVDRMSLALLDGTIVDFVKQGLNEAFRFRNPNVKGECGCGESFSV